MRLAQAARNLSITTDDIVTFLAKRNIIIEKDSNTKLNETSIDLLFEFFDIERPTSREEIKNSNEAEQTGIQDFDSEQQHTELPASEPELEKVEEINLHNSSEQADKDLKEPQIPAHLNDSITVDGDFSEEDEKAGPVTSQDQEAKGSTTDPQQYKTVADLLEEEKQHDVNVIIKAPKVTLQGLNVLGKIDLPEPKPKQEKEELPKPDKREQVRNRSSKRTASKSNRKELTPQQIREREKKKALRKQEEKERRAKQKRAEFYKEQILKPKQEQQKRKKPKQKLRKSENSIENQATPRPVPKTVIGKFWRWLNT